MEPGCVTPNHENIENSLITFKDIGLNDELVRACLRLNWITPTAIQREALSLALQGFDVIGLAETGSGKNGAFILALLDGFLCCYEHHFGLVLTPNRESAVQIAEQIKVLAPGLKCAVIAGGIDASQSITMANWDIAIATPGCFVDYLKNANGASMKAVRFLVMDQADRVLDTEFEEVNKILDVIPREMRCTALFSTTMTSNMEKFQLASMVDPVRVEIPSGCDVVDNILQYYEITPHELKDLYLVNLINEAVGHFVVVFCAECNGTSRIALLLRALGITAVPLHGQMPLSKQLAALNEFKSQNQGVLITTLNASRALDIPNVNWVIIYDIPANSKDYIDCVGHAARGRRRGKAITFFDRHDLNTYRRIEFQLGRKWRMYPSNESYVFSLLERVAEAQILALKDLGELEGEDPRCGKTMNPNVDQLNNCVSFSRVKKLLM